MIGARHRTCARAACVAGAFAASQNAPYLQMAQTYTFADRMFETNQGPSYPAHQFLPSRTSEPGTGSDLLVSREHGEAGLRPWRGFASLESDHPKLTDGSGPSWVASIVNAVGTSQYWNDTAIFIVWDDWGGWYDHVAPPIYGPYELGFRVPLIVVSPYAKPHYVSHVQHEFGSILKFTEEAFGLGSLGFTDTRADDLADCFNLYQAPAAFHAIRAPLDASHFLHRPLDLSPPDDD